MPRVIGLFQSQERADRCLAELEQQGFTPDQVRVILFRAGRRRQRGRGLADWMARGGFLGDTMDQADGVSVLDGVAVTASLGGLWGLVWGSRLPWGPVTVGFLGILGGALVGLVWDRFMPERRRALYQTSRLKGLVQIEVVADDRRAVRLAKSILARNRVDQTAVVPVPTT